MNLQFKGKNIISSNLELLMMHKIKMLLSKKIQIGEIQKKKGGFTF